MSHDDIVRLVLLGYVAAFMPVGLYYRIRSHTGERLDRWQEGGVILFGLRITGLVIALAGLVWMIHPPWMAWSSVPVPAWIRWSGLAGGAAGGLLWGWAVSHLKHNLTDTVVTRAKATLVTTGPYRLVRHPFYTAAMLGGYGAGLAMANWFVIAAHTVAVVFLVNRTSIEEAKLVERFGDEYRRYMQRTGRFLPRWK